MSRLNIDANEIINDLLRRITELTRENAIKTAQVAALEKAMIEKKEEVKE